MSAPLAPTSPALAPFLAAGVLDDGDVALALAVLEATGAQVEDAALLGLALAVRAPRAGHVCVPLATVADEVVREGAPGEPLPWPEPGAWRDALAACPLVAAPGDAGAHPRAPLVFDGERLYTSRLWHDEAAVAERLLTLAARGDLQIVTGGPGTGKTTLIARQLLEHLERLAPADTFPVALAAPTGKAAARMKEVLAGALAREGAGERTRGRMRDVHASTLHRLLRSNPVRLDARYGHHAAHPLPYALIIVDEVSMVSLPMLARLLDAVGPGTRLVLAGDPDQLASVEAGSVLADVVGSRVARDGALAGGLVRLTESWRFSAGSGIGRLAAALRDGDGDGALAVLQEGATGVRWIDPSTQAGRWEAEALEDEVAAQAGRVVEAALDGDGARALTELLAARTLCAHRSGEWGVANWNRRTDDRLGPAAATPWYPGRPLLVTRNDRTLDLMNGDLGVVIRTPKGLRVAFPAAGGDGVRLIPPARLGEVETVHAMTIHKSQGSEFGAVHIVLPPPESRVLTRELLYTAVTRAQRAVTVVGTEAAIREGTRRRAARASGLGARPGWRGSDSEQLSAATCGAGPPLILAGSGTG